MDGIKRARKIDIFKYGFGGVGSNFAFILAMMYLSYFYTDIAGIDPIVVSGLMLVSRLIDAFTDPLMGVIADRTKTKWGQYRPYLLFGAPLLGISIVLLFSMPNISPTLKIVYAYVVYISYSLLSTAVNIPYHALLNVISDDPSQRSTIVAVKQGLSTIPQIVVGSLTLPIVKMFGGGSTGWTMYGIVIAVFTTVSFWICASSGKRSDIEENIVIAPRRENENMFMTLLHDMSYLFKNKEVIMVMIALGTDLFASSISSAMNIYYFKYVTGNENLVSVVNMITLVVGILAVFLFPVLCKKFGKRKVMLVASAICIVPNVLMMFIPSPKLALVATVSAICGMLSRLTAMMGWAMLPDCVDYGEWKLGIRNAGLTSSALTFMNKVGQAFGGTIALAVLGLVGFAANQDQTPLVLTTISTLRWGAPAFGYLCSVIAMHFYTLSEPKMREIETELQKRRKQVSQKEGA